MTERDYASDAAVALARYLIIRDWPNGTARKISVSHAYLYGVMAAAIVNGEAWAIKEAWPESVLEIIGTRSPSI